MKPDPQVCHYVAKSLPHRLLARDSIEAVALWDMLTAAFPELLALCVMPDHIHLLLPHQQGRQRLARIASGWARSRFHAGKRSLWARIPEPEIVRDRDKIRRTVRYIHLNPCAARLVSCPLAWPFSTHRDRVGLAARPVMSRHRDPEAFHRYVSSDDRVDRAGTPLPQIREFHPTWPEVIATVQSVCRASDRLNRRGLVRTLAVRAALHFGLRDPRLPADTGLGRTQLYALARDLPPVGAPVADPALAACLRALGDARFDGLPAFPSLPGWWFYEARQGAAPKFSGSERSFPGRPYSEAVRSETGNAGGKPQTSRQGEEGRG